MKKLSLVLLLLFGFVLSVTKAASKRPSRGALVLSSRRATLLSLQKQQQQQQQQDPSLSATLLSLRGGEVQDTMQSLIDTLQAKVPILASILQSFLRLLERIFHVSLLPKHKVTTRSTKKRRKKRHTKISVDENDEKEVIRAPSKRKSSSSKKTKKPSSSNKHLSKPLSSKSPNYRIQKELKEFMQNPPPNLKVKVGSNIRVWIVEMKGAEGSIYEGESFRLRVAFPPAYPTVPPSVYFLPPPPLHEHVYTNGDICLSLLGKGWQPQMTAQSIAVSILSILSSAQSKSLPMDNARHSQNKPGQYQKDWVYHDDNC